MPERDPFLREAWEERAREEHGEPERETDSTAVEELPAYERDMLKIYLGLKEKAGENPELKKFLLDVEADGLTYEHSIVKVEKARLEDAAQEDIAAADERRRTVHNALLADIDILARVFERANLDTGWRNMIGSTRDEIGNWTLIVAKYLRKPALEAYEHRKTS